MKKIIQRALAVREKYQRFEKQQFGRNWSAQDLAQGLAGDVGDLQKIVMAKAGIRKISGVDQKLKHELADCLWSIIVLADKYEIDLEQAFHETMDKIEKKIA